LLVAIISTSITLAGTVAVQRAMSPTTIVTFDAGQTLVELDLDFLAARLAERGIATTAAALSAAAPAAWHVYDELVEAGQGHPWHALMSTLLKGAGIANTGELVEWLWQEQPRANLWRKPIPEMIALARELAAAGARVAVLSNSEGRLAELLAEIGVADAFAAVIDSGREGVAKPDPRIFARTLEVLGGRAADAIHVGDSWPADVEGALGAGWHAVWFRVRGAVPHELPPRVAVARDAGEVRAALRAFAAGVTGGERARDQR
jgi:putative hydrolase of the HAD superfamily